MRARRKRVLLYHHAVERWRHYEEFCGTGLHALAPVAAELGYAAADGAGGATSSLQ